MSSSSADSSAQVLIAGGGPVGMLLASELALLGVGVVVVERHASPVDQPRAGTIHARSVQSLLRRGLVDAAHDNDPRDRATLPYFFAGLPGLTMNVPATEGPPILSMPQLELEQMFEARARTAGAIVLRQHEILSVSQHADGVEASVEGPDGLISMTGQYLVGADGARSLVRQQLGFESVSHPPTLAAMVARVRIIDPAAAPVGFKRTARGWTRIDLNPSGLSRAITFDFDGPSDDRQAPVGVGEFQDTFERIAGVRVPMSAPTFAGRFSDYCRLVTEYRRGRALLIGDAAHVHFPIGGQGLSLGIQDTLNLGWKLAAVLSGGDDRLLDSYHRERHPIARRVVSHTRAQVELMRPGATYEPLRELFSELLDLEEVAEHLAQMVSGQDIVQPRDGATGGGFQLNVPLHTKDGPTSIARLLSSAQPVLVCLGGAGDGIGASAAPWSDKIRIVAAECRFGLPWSCALIRPDGYVAWTDTGVGSGADELASTLERWFGRGRPEIRRGPDG